MMDWREFINDLHARTKRKLMEELLFSKNDEFVSTNLWEIEDNQAYVHVGYYFGRRDEDEWTEIRTQMVSRIKVMEDPLGLIRGHTIDGVDFVQSAVDKYKMVDRELRQMLYVLMMATCGPPPRVTEMTSLKFINSIMGPRDIFVVGGQVMFVTEYHKSQSIMKKLKVYLYEGNNI